METAISVGGGNSARLTCLETLPSANDTLIPTECIEAYTGITRQTHARWRHEGVGPKYTRLGGRVFYRSGDVRAWIRGQVRQNTIRI
jgi:predicted DNA-binding transcriptional regulator AlpA